MYRHCKEICNVLAIDGAESYLSSQLTCECVSVIEYYLLSFKGLIYVVVVHGTTEGDVEEM